ncbi:hypothetical protein Vafri_20195 [Volvox africanus]|uniref:Uncharacterized protein n=1 Tax=Volvox africanus TaxID=51714 RepID=A0A8J4BRX6_9CHLO|nr:hypothetical protein Vafri_20195 [Volvox africanus]
MKLDPESDKARGGGLSNPASCSWPLSPPPVPANDGQVVVMDSSAPLDAAALMADGRRHFEAAEYEAAANCYSCALLRMPDAAGAGSHLLATTLNNLSAALLKLGDTEAALLCATAAAAVQPGNSTAHVRIALAAGRVGPSLALAARAELHRARELIPGGDLDATEWLHMVSEIGPLPQVHTAPTSRQASQGRKDLLRAISSAAPGALLSLMPLVPESVNSSRGKGTGGAGGDCSAPSVAADAAAIAAAYSRSGNVAFKSADYEGARRQYLTALRTLTEALPASKLLSNLAACHLQQGNHKGALAAATASLVLQPRVAKAHYRRATALLEMRWLEEAEAACEVGLSAVPPSAEGHTEIAHLLERIRTAKATEAAEGADPSSRRAASTSASASTGNLAEQDLHSLRMAVEETAFMRMMIDLAHKDPRVKARLREMRREQPLIWRSSQRDTRVPPFHEEYDKAARWLPGCDVAECLKRLWKSYEICATMPGNLLAMAHPDGMLPMDLMKRVGVIDPWSAHARLDWLLSAPDGAISFLRDAYEGRDSPRVFYSFPDWALPTIPMYSQPLLGPGTVSTNDDGTRSTNRKYGDCSSRTDDDNDIRTHVAIRFVDLGTLAASVNLPEWDEQVKAAEAELRRGDAGGYVSSTEGSSSRRLLLRWVGFEASPYAVAKTLVLERLLRTRGAAATGLALQVWFSATWTSEAHTAFRRTVTELLAENWHGGREGSGNLPTAVLSYLRHWQRRDVSLEESRQRWLSDSSRMYSEVGQFRDKADRLALCEYLLTGQLPGLGGSDLVGSVVMFAIPEGAEERSLGECFLQSIHPDDLLDARLANSATADQGPSPGPGGSSSTLTRKEKDNKDKGSGRSGAKATSSEPPSNSSSGAAGHGGQMDILAAAVALMRRRVRRMASLIATGRVEVQLHLKAVEPDSTAISTIAALRPATISWSNVPDFYPPAAFHKLARSCSVPRTSATSSRSSSTGGTTHYVASCNWPRDIKGASHLDMLWACMDAMEDESGRGGGRRGRGGGRGGGGGGDDDIKVPKKVSDLIFRLVDEGEQAIRLQLARYGGGPGAGLLLDPPVEYPQNVADFGLYMKHYQTWVDAFLAAGCIRRPRLISSGRRRPEIIAPPVYAALSLTNSIVALAFSYDE